MSKKTNKHTSNNTENQNEAPISRIDKENQRIIDSYDYLSNAASSQDCTGLIPSEPVSEAELESYEDLYHFLPPNGDVRNIGEK